MFARCDSLKDIKPLANWCVPKDYDVVNMFIDESDEYAEIDIEDYEESEHLPKNISEEQIDWLNKNIKRHD